MKRDIIKAMVVQSEKIDRRKFFHCPRVKDEARAIGDGRPFSMHQRM